MRREQLYLADIVEAADEISEFVADVSRDDFLSNKLVRSAVLQKLTVIGEAAARLPMEFRERHQGIKWSRIVGFRNIAVHAYFSVEWPIVWTAATEDAPMLRDQIARILNGEYSTDT